MDNKSSERIKKPAIIITSLGRTGTKFFQTLLGNLIPGSIALHEPDVLNFFQYEQGSERLKQVSIQLSEVGFANLFIRKSLGNWSLIKLSDDRVIGSIDHSSVIKKVSDQRFDFVAGVKGSPYIESNIGYYGILDTLGDVFRQYRGAYIIRDGRSWIRSHMNWGQMYGKKWLQRKFAHTWPTAFDCGEESLNAWESRSKFEKLCWAWVRLNEYAIHTIHDNPYIRIVKFEDIFTSDQCAKNLEGLLEFLLSFEEPIDFDKTMLEKWLAKRIHTSNEKFPEFQYWSDDKKEYFHTTCGPLMEQLGYSK